MPEIRIVTTNDGHIGSITEDGKPWPPPAPIPVPPAAPKLSWAPPSMMPLTVHLNNAKPNLTLEAGKDYEVVPDEPITVKGGASLIGGRNVVMLGGEVDFAAWFGTTADSRSKDNRALYLKNFTGTMHVEGFLGAGVMGEGIDVDTRTPGAILQLQNVHVAQVSGAKDPDPVTKVGGNHADIVQNWGGPTEYRIDRLTGYSNYQGFMLQPTQYDQAMATNLCDFRHLDLHIVKPGRYAFYRTSSGTKSIKLTEVYVEVEAYPTGVHGYPETDPTWATIINGKPAVGEFVKATDVGIDYVSPGYV